MHRLAWDDAGRLDVDAATFRGVDRTLAIDGIAQGVNNATEKAEANRHVDDGAGALDRVTFLDVAVIAEDHDADVVILEVQGHAPDTTGEFDHLAGLHLVEAVDAGDTVTDG